jgi:hypothetical protein
MVHGDVGKQSPMASVLSSEAQSMLSRQFLRARDTARLTGLRRRQRTGGRQERGIGGSHGLAQAASGAHARRMAGSSWSLPFVLVVLGISGCATSNEAWPREPEAGVSLGENLVARFEAHRHFEWRDRGRGGPPSRLHGFGRARASGREQLRDRPVLWRALRNLLSRLSRRPSGARALRRGFRFEAPASAQRSARSTSARLSRSALLRPALPVQDGACVSLAITNPAGESWGDRGYRMW